MIAITTSNSIRVNPLLRFMRKLLSLLLGFEFVAQDLRSLRVAYPVPLHASFCPQYRELCAGGARQGCYYSPLYLGFSFSASGVCDAVGCIFSNASLPYGTGFPGMANGA